MSSGKTHPRMPDFVNPTRAFHHTLGSAIESLERLGVSRDRLTLEWAGAGEAFDRIVAQDPAKGAPIAERDRVTLRVSGTGSFESHPHFLRRRSVVNMESYLGGGGPEESHFAIDRLLAVLDNPLIKLRHHVREGARYLRLSDGTGSVARRWIEDLFQLRADDWTDELWYSLARVLPELHRRAGTFRALDLGMQRLFRLPISQWEVRRGVVPFGPLRRISLGEVGSRLGVDTALGAGLPAPVSLDVVIGPVPLDVYLEQTKPEWELRRRELYRLVLPARLYPSVNERWSVGDPTEPMVLAEDERPRLGVNSRLAPARHGGKRA